MKKRKTEAQEPDIYDAWRPTLAELLEEMAYDDEFCEQPVDLNARYCEDTRLHRIAHRGNVWCARLLLEAGADPNIPGDLSVSPLYWAVRSGNLGLAKLLLDHGARVDVRNEFGSNDLGACSPRGLRANPAMFKLLKSYWPNVKPRT